MPVDPVDALQPGDVPLAPRPEFRDELRRRLVAAVHDPEGESMTATATRPAWLYYCTLPTRDVGRAERFYTALFGWQVERTGAGLHVDGVQPPMGVGVAERLAPQAWFVVDDVRRAAAAVVAHGGAAGEPVHYESGWSVDCRDDQGTEFGLSEPAYETAPVSSSRHGELFYLSLPVADGERARRFYGAVLGWTFDAAGDQGGEHVANVRPDCGIGVGRDGHAPELWFRVDDLDSAMARVVELGGTATPVGEGPEGRHAACTDDQGVAFGISQPSPGF